MKHLTPLVYNVPNKLECLAVTSLSKLVLCLREKVEPAREKHLSGAPLLGRLLALPVTLDYIGKAYHGQPLMLIMNVSKLRI
jgi:hypothetical protein